MLKSETRRIGAYDYTVLQLDAVKGRRALVRLAKAVAPIVNAPKGKGKTKGDLATIGTALIDVADRLSEDDIDYFCDLFAANTVVSGGDIGTKAPSLADIFALHFAGLYKEMGQWLLFALEVNFGSFFKGLGVVKHAPAAAASASPSTSPNTSTGSSGD